MRPISENFRDSFWTPYSSTEPFSNYRTGLRALHDKLNKSVLENKAIASYLQKRIDTEIACALLFETELSSATVLASNIVESTMNATIKSSFDTICQESKETAHCYRVRAGILAQEVLEPLENFTSLFESELDIKKAKMDEEALHFEHEAQAALMTRSVYWHRCQTLELVCPDFRFPVPAGFQDEENEDDVDYDTVANEEDFIGGRRRRSSSVTSELNVDRGGIRLGKVTVLPYREVAKIVNRMQKMIESSKPNAPNSRKYLGKHIFEWIRDYCSNLNHDYEKNVTLDSEAQEICQHLVVLKFLKNVPKDKGGFTLELYYEVQQNVVDRYLRKTRIRSNMDKEQPDAIQEGAELALVAPSTTALENASSIGFFNGLFGKLKPQKKPSMGLASKAHKEMIEADEVYKKKIKQVNKSRMQLEENMVAHLDEMQQLEMSRVNAIKHAFVAMSKPLSNSLPMFQEMYQRIALFQESVQPGQDINYIIEQFKTGPFCPKPMIYENYYYGCATDQIFGVPLEEVAQVYGSYVPPIISRGIKCIDKALLLKRTTEMDALVEEIWSTIIPMHELNTICAEVDNLAGSRLRKSLEQYQPHVLANLIRIFLLELPECLLTFDLYEPVKILYSTQQDIDSRLMSVSKLLATLPSPNYHTIKAISCHLSQLLKQTKNDGLLSHLISSFAYILMRPGAISSYNIHDRHPKKLIRDLFTQYDTIFTQDINKAQKSGASRSAIIADETPVQRSISNESLESESILRRTLIHIIHSNATETDTQSQMITHQQQDYHSNNFGAYTLPLVPYSDISVFEDPDNSRSYSHLSDASTSLRDSMDRKDLHALDYVDRVDTKRLSTDVSLILDPEEDECDAIEIYDINNNRIIPAIEKRHNRSRASTQGTMDNVSLEPNRLPGK